MLHTDVHCHVLPAIDDGSRTAAESLLMARGLADLGVRRLHATPHQFRMGNDLDPAWVRDRVAALQEEFRAQGVELELHASAEHLFSERLLEALERGEPMLSWSGGENGAEECLLIELPIREPVVGVSALARRLAQRGVVPVMAHPERIQMVQRKPSLLETWRQAGWRYQLDLLSLVGGYGRHATWVSTELMRLGAYSFVGSDLHRPSQLQSLARAHDRFRQLAGAEIDA